MYDKWENIFLEFVYSMYVVKLYDNVEVVVYVYFVYYCVFVKLKEWLKFVILSGVFMVFIGLMLGGFRLYFLNC